MFVRDGHGWFAKDKRQRFVPLTDKAGAPIKDQSTSEAAKDAYACFIVAQSEQPEETAPRTA
jgi:hypothetical protein